MISESQERMLRRRPAGSAGRGGRGLPALGPALAVIGRVTGDGDLVIVKGGWPRRRPSGARELARIPARALTTDAIVHARRPPRRLSTGPGARPWRPADRDAIGLPERGMNPGAVPLALLGIANLSSRRPGLPAVRLHRPGEHGGRPWPWRGRAPHQGHDQGPRRDDRLQPAPSACLDPWLGGSPPVAEATRNVSITGARPLGVTNCLNFGDPTRPEAFWQLTEGVRGLADACRALGLPVTGGNVSLYNESPTGAIAPTPKNGVVGLLDDVATLVGPAFQMPLDAVLIVGEPLPGWPGRPTPRWREPPPRTDHPAWTSLAKRPCRPSSARRSPGSWWPLHRTSPGGGLAVDRRAAIAVERLHHDVLVLVAEGADLLGRAGDERRRHQVEKIEHEHFLRRVAHGSRIVDHDRAGCSRSSRCVVVI